MEILLIDVPRKKIVRLGKGGVDDPIGGAAPPGTPPLANDFLEILA